MLMQNFKSATDLGISDQEQASLIKVLGMLERAELRYASGTETECENGFNIGTQGKGCGTPACIGGWVARIMGIGEMEYVDSYMPDFSQRKPDKALSGLYWRYPKDVGVEEAATALRSFLTTGDARWDLAVSP